jgi:hypothetical protein
MNIEKLKRKTNPEQSKLVSRLIAEKIRKLDIWMVVSINNGDFQTPLDGIYESDMEYRDLVNLSLNPKKSQKLLDLLIAYETKKKPIAVYLKNIEIDSLEEGLSKLPQQRSERNRLIVITNILEDLDSDDKYIFLRTLYENIEDDDLCIVTFKTANNEDQMISDLENVNFDVHVNETETTPDGASTSLIISKVCTDI